MEYTALLEKQIISRLRVDNPWWVEGKIPEYYSQMTPRPYLNSFMPMVEETSLKRALLLMGPRRVGKTVMMFHSIERLIDCGVAAQNIIYLSVETPIYTNVYLEQLFTLACQILGKNPSREQMFVFFDEIQYLKDWEVNLKSLVDTYKNVKFVASGSAAAELKKKSDESGAGRFTDFYLPPLTFYEYIHLKGYSSLVRRSADGRRVGETTIYETIDTTRLNELFVDYTNYGGYPEVVFSDKARENPGQFVRHDIIDKVLLRDLPNLYGINDVQELNSLFTMIAYHSGSQFSYEKLACDTGIRKETLRRYITYLSAAFLVRVVGRTDDTARNYQRATNFKIYLTNPSLHCALFQPLREGDNEMGNMMETTVYAQWFSRQGVDLRYANWHRGRQQGEVDIVGLAPGSQKPAWAVEVKWSDRFVERPQELTSLQYFMERNKIDSALVTTLSRHATLRIADTSLHFVPTACYAYALGADILA